MRVFAKVVERFKLQQKVLLITNDNGSSVLKLTTNFEAYTRACPTKW